MSSDSSILLRMLEPAVRPGRADGAGASARPGIGGLPFEQTAFEVLLKDARQSAGPAQSADIAASNVPAAAAGLARTIADPLARLGSFDRIDNVQLRENLAAQRRAPEGTNGPNAGADAQSTAL